MAKLEPRIREIAHELLDTALESAKVDLVQVLTYPLPVWAISDLI